MRSIRFSNLAAIDIESIHLWSSENFGGAALERYAGLIDTALNDLAIDPERPGSQSFLDPDGIEWRGYHLRFSRKRVRAVGVVKNPRHIIAYRIITPEVIYVLRVLYDGMDLSRHIQTKPDTDAE